MPSRVKNGFLLCVASALSWASCGLGLSGCRSAAESLLLKCRVDDVTYQSLALAGGKVLPMRSAKLTVMSGLPKNGSELSLDLFQEASAADESFVKGNIIQFVVFREKLEKSEGLSQGDLREVVVVTRAK